MFDFRLRELERVLWRLGAMAEQVFKGVLLYNLLCRLPPEESVVLIGILLDDGLSENGYILEEVHTIDKLVSAKHEGENRIFSFAEILGMQIVANHPTQQKLLYAEMERGKSLPEKQCQWLTARGFTVDDLNSSEIMTVCKTFAFCQSNELPPPEERVKFFSIFQEKKVQLSKRWKQQAWLVAESWGLHDKSDNSAKFSWRLRWDIYTLIRNSGNQDELIGKYLLWKLNLDPQAYPKAISGIRTVDAAGSMDRFCRNRINSELNRADQQLRWAYRIMVQNNEPVSNEWRSTRFRLDSLLSK